MKHIAFSLLFLFAAAAPASAMPGASGSATPGNRFAAADTNKDGFVTREEFAAAFPSLKAEAFAIIDADKDGRISAAEWAKFTSGHGKNAATPPPGHPPVTGNEAPPANTGQNTLPLLPIPQGGSPAAPEGKQTQEGLPLLTPPAR